MRFRCLCSNDYVCAISRTLQCDGFSDPSAGSRNKDSLACELAEEDKDEVADVRRHGQIYIIIDVLQNILVYQYIARIPFSNDAKQI